MVTEYRVWMYRESVKRNERYTEFNPERSHVLHNLDIIVKRVMSHKKA